MLFDPYDVDAFIDRIEQVLALSGEETENIASSIRESVFKRFNGERIKKELMEVFLS